jgi:uncharacterized membrane protein
MTNIKTIISQAITTTRLITGAIVLAVIALGAIILVVILHGFEPESAALFAAWATIVGVVITQMVAARLAQYNQAEQQKLTQSSSGAALPRWFPPPLISGHAEDNPE